MHCEKQYPIYIYIYQDEGGHSAFWKIILKYKLIKI